MGQSPIPNPQSPIPKIFLFFKQIFIQLSYKLLPLFKSFKNSTIFK
ncbi:MAG: hypothetical protein MJ252_10210 [archaeon]|nr:hypothetical protein [archaeon]